MFYRSDVLRQAVTLLRINDYLVSGGRRTPRNTIGVGEMILALQRLFRQWELHLALYKHIAWKKPELQKRVPDEEIDAPKPQLSAPWRVSLRMLFSHRQCPILKPPTYHSIVPMPMIVLHCCPFQLPYRVDIPSL